MTRPRHRLCTTAAAFLLAMLPAAAPATASAPNHVQAGKECELRARVTDTIGVVGFVDAGYVDADSFPEFSEDLKVGVGAGLRYITGLGPIRLDLAFPLDPGPDDPDIAFYVGLGQAFWPASSWP